MPDALRISSGGFGRVALLDMDRSLVRHANPHCHILLKVDGPDTGFLVGDDVAPLTDDSAVLIDAWTPHAYLHRPGAPRTLILALYIEPSWLARLRGNWHASGDCWGRQRPFHRRSRHAARCAARRLSALAPCPCPAGQDRPRRRAKGARCRRRVHRRRARRDTRPLLVTSKTPTGLNRGFGGPQVYLRSRRMSGAEAFAWGLVVDCVSGTKVEEATISLVNELRAFSLLAQRTAKKLINDSENATVATGIELEGHAYARLCQSEDFVERVDAFTRSIRPNSAAVRL